MLDFKDFFVTEIFSHLANCLFFSCQKACQTNNFRLRTTKFCQNQPKGKPQKQEKSHDAASYMKVAMKVFPGLSLCGAHCTKHVEFLSAQARSPCNKAAQTAGSNSVGADFLCFPLQAVRVTALHLEFSV
jgi:hypothetical protein